MTRSLPIHAWRTERSRGLSLHRRLQENRRAEELDRRPLYITADYVGYMAEWARRIEGEIIPSDRPNETIFLFRKPVGVVGGILPWNFPFFLFARKMAPALITGNTIIIKPSEETPLNAAIFAQIIIDSELPAGVVNVVHGARKSARPLPAARTSTSSPSRAARALDRQSWGQPRKTSPGSTWNSAARRPRSSGLIATGCLLQLQSVGKSTALKVLVGSLAPAFHNQEQAPPLSETGGRRRSRRSCLYVRD
jgi:hypothetical protein